MTLDTAKLTEIEEMLTDEVLTDEELIERLRAAGRCEVARVMARAAAMTMELGYARVSTTHQDLDRQYAALDEHGIAAEQIYADKKTGATIDRPQFTEMLRYARPGDTIVAGALDRLGRNLRECLNVVHELREQGIGIKTFA